VGTAILHPVWQHRKLRLVVVGRSAVGADAHAEGEGAVDEQHKTGGGGGEPRGAAVDDARPRPLCALAGFSLANAANTLPPGLPQLSEKLAEGKRLLFLADHVVALAALHESHKRLRDVVARGLAAAALTGRVFVMPSIPCDAPWIRHGGGEGKTHSLHGVQDPRIVITGAEEAPVCHVGVHPNSQCWPWKFVAYSYDPIVQRRLPGAKVYTMFEQDAISADAADVVLGITPHQLQEQGEDSQTRSKSVQAECKAFFEEDGLKEPDPTFVE